MLGRQAARTGDDDGQNAPPVVNAQRTIAHEQNIDRSRGQHRSRIDLFKKGQAEAFRKPAIIDIRSDMARGNQFGLDGGAVSPGVFDCPRKMRFADAAGPEKARFRFHRIRGRKAR